MDRSRPDLSGNFEGGAIDSAQWLPQLNLAGSNGIPSSSQIARSTNPLERGSDSSYSIHTPDFALPDMTTPDLHPYNLVAPDIDDYGTDPSQPDPIIGPTLAGLQRPYGLDLYNAHDMIMDNTDLFWPGPIPDDLLNFDEPQDLLMIRHPLQADPTLPDLQHPQLEQEMHMPARPGDLSPEALDLLHAQPFHDGIDDIPYAKLFMDQTGMNTTRRRHMDLLEGDLEN